MDIILATNNAHKVQELRRMLEPLGYTLYSQKEKGISIEVEENGTTFEENAFLKAKAIYDLTGCAALADDSGLCVDALSGAPGSTPPGTRGSPATIRRITKSSSKRWTGWKTAPPSSSVSSATLTPGARTTISAAECPGEVGFEERGRRLRLRAPLQVGEKSTPR